VQEPRRCWAFLPLSRLSLQAVIISWRLVFYASERQHGWSFLQLQGNCLASLCCFFLQGVFKHRFLDLVFDGDRCGKFDLSSKSMRLHRCSCDLLQTYSGPPKSHHQKPIPPLDGISGACLFGRSATIASVVMSSPAIDAAPCSAARTTFVGSMITFDIILASVTLSSVMPR
jgi:hypothetical protein